MTEQPRLPWTTNLTDLPRLDPDVALLRQFRATGNPALFEILFRKYQCQIFRLVNRMVDGEEAYDITQDVFVRALRSIHAFKGDCKFSTWLYTIAKNTCFNHIRDRKKRESIEDFSLDQPNFACKTANENTIPDRASDISRIVETRELQREVERVLSQLTPEQRLLLTLRDYEQLSYEEIGEIMELSNVNVKSKIHRARLAFKAKFGPYMTHADPDIPAGNRVGK